jgi:hypothetical protein
MTAMRLFTIGCMPDLYFIFVTTGRDHDEFRNLEAGEIFGHRLLILREHRRKIIYGNSIEQHRFIWEMGEPFAQNYSICPGKAINYITFFPLAVNHVRPKTVITVSTAGNFIK